MFLTMAIQKPKFSSFKKMNLFLRFVIVKFIEMDLNGYFINIHLKPQSNPAITKQLHKISQKKNPSIFVNFHLQKKKKKFHKNHICNYYQMKVAYLPLNASIPIKFVPNKLSIQKVLFPVMSQKLFLKILAELSIKDSLFIFNGHVYSYIRDPTLFPTLQ